MRETGSGVEWGKAVVKGDGSGVRKFRKQEKHFEGWEPIVKRMGTGSKVGGDWQIYTPCPPLLPVHKVKVIVLIVNHVMIVIVSMN